MKEYDDIWWRVAIWNWDYCKYREPINLRKKFQQFIDDEPYVKSSIAEILLSNNSPTYKFVREVEYINGITSDFTILDEENKKS